jgi:hypothetical protein
VTSLRGVVIDRDSDTREFFSEVASRVSLSALQLGTEKVINSLEAVVAVKAVKLWARLAQHRRVFIFVDNDDARACLN